MQQLIEIIDSREKKIIDVEVLETQLPLDDLDVLNIQCQKKYCEQGYCEVGYSSDNYSG